MQLNIEIYYSFIETKRSIFQMYFLYHNFKKY